MEPTIKSSVDNLYENVKVLINHQKEILVLDAAEKSSKLLSEIVADISIATISGMILLFISIASAWLIGESLHNMPMGFFIISFVYALILVLILIINKSIIQVSLINYFIKRFLNAFQN